MRLFVGCDEREQVGLSVFCHSVWSRASRPVSITVLNKQSAHLWGGKRDASNEFSYARFLVPFLCDYKGAAIFADGADMLCRADVRELFDLYDPWKAVQVVKHDYQTKHPVKFLGEPNEDFPRKNWTSLMLINCAHYSWRQINPDTIKGMTGANLQRLKFIRDEWIGELPREWNWLVDEYHFNPAAKLAHFTIGLPVWYPDCSYAKEWRRELEKANYFQAASVENKNLLPV